MFATPHCRRLLVVHKETKRAGIAGEITFRVLEAALDVVGSLKPPIKRLAGKKLPPD